jgi:hypothetical protein
MSATPVSAAPLPLPETSTSVAAAGSATTVARESFLTSDKLAAWSKKSVSSFIDQGLTALTGFSVSFLLARWMSPDVYGAYAIAFAAYLFICGFHNVLILEPMSVLGPARHAAAWSSYFRAQVAIHVLLAGVLSVTAMLGSAVIWRLAPHSPLVGATLGSALALPLLLFLWLARRMCYVLRRPIVATLGSGSCLAIVLVGLYALRDLAQLTPFTAFLLVGGGSFIGSCLILRQLRTVTWRSDFSDRLSWQSILRENWSYGRWLVGTAILYPISSQVQMFLVAAFLGLGSAGILRAMMLPAAVMTQAVSATDLLILPGLSLDFGHGALRSIRYKSILVSCALGAAGICFAALLYFVAGPAEHLFFRGKFAPYVWLMPVLALIPAANGFNVGFSAALRASQKPHFDLLANSIAAPVAVITALGFIQWRGLAGAAISLVAGYAALAFVNWGSFCFHVWHSPQHERLPALSAVSSGSES